MNVMSVAYCLIYINLSGLFEVFTNLLLLLIVNPFHTGRVIFHQNLKWQMEAYQTPQMVLVALTLYIPSGNFSHMYEG